MNWLSKEALIRINTEAVRPLPVDEIAYEIHEKLGKIEFRHIKSKEMLTQTIYTFVCSDFADSPTIISWASLSEKSLKSIQRKMAKPTLTSRGSQSICTTFSGNVPARRCMIWALRLPKKSDGKSMHSL